MSKGCNYLALDQNSVLVNLLVEWLTERDGVFCSVVARRGLTVFVEPTSKADEVKTRPVGETVPTELIVGADPMFPDPRIVQKSESRGRRRSRTRVLLVKLGLLLV